MGFFPLSNRLIDLQLHGTHRVWSLLGLFTDMGQSHPSLPSWIQMWPATGFSQLSVCGSEKSHFLLEVFKATVGWCSPHSFLFAFYHWHWWCLRWCNLGHLRLDHGERRDRSCSRPVIQFSSLAQLCLTLQPHGLQPGVPTPRAHSNSCPWSQWCHPTFSSSVIPFSSCFPSFPAWGSFLRSQFFSSGSQSIGASASASLLPINVQYWFPLGLTGLISLQSKGLSSVFSSTTVQKHKFFSAQLSLWPKSHIHTWLLEKP